ncbi:MAG: tripartite tricarboxylate transporter substrate binding protein [Polaromonas sp.]|nr:tripartite tricarboxylate transporter substrate binding protein [Polaromonas sp.]
MVLPFSAAAQTYPSKPIRFVVPYTAGGTSDAIARQVGQRLSDVLKQPVIIENKGGAGGTVGTAQVAAAPADGYTVLVTLSSHAINPGLYKSLSYDTEKDFKAVTLLANGPQILAIHPKIPANTLKEYVEWLKKNPAESNYASGGQGTPGHLAAELLSSMAGIKFQHIPYRGGGAAVIDVIGGQVNAVWVTAIAAIPHVKAGRLKALAVTTNDRIAALPNVPTIAESGYPGYAVDAWVGMFVPAATPQTTVDMLYKSTVVALANPELKAALLAQGSEIIGNPPAETTAAVSSEIKLWRKLIAERGIKPE